MGEEIPLDNNFEEVFKPLFAQYESEGGMPMSLVREKLREAGITTHVPPGRVDYLMRQADRNKDGHLNYEEFMRLITENRSSLNTAQLSKFQKFVRGAVSSVVPAQVQDKQGEYVVDSYIDHYNCVPPPLFMIIISLAEIIIFIVYAVELKGTNHEVTASSGYPSYSPLIFNPSRRYEVWRFLTYMFIHVGYMHLIFNLLFQLLLGLPLEMVHKWWRIGIVYCLGVIAGSLCHTLFDTRTMLAGASGGCYSLIGAHFAIIITNWKEMTHEWMDGPIKFISSGPVRLVFWTLMAVADTAMSIYNRYNNEGDSVGYAAHFGGALAGLLVGIPVLKNIDVKPWEKVVWWVALIAYILCVIFAVLWNTFYKEFPETDWSPCCSSPVY